MKSLFYLLILFITSLQHSSSQPHRLHHLHHHKTPSHPPQPQPQPQPQPIESIELTPPLPTSNLPNPPQQCTHLLFRHSFADTMNKPPFTTPYSPPLECPPPWSAAVIHLHGEVSGEQYDRIAAVWIGGVEVLRSSTPEPSVNGTFWNVYKDVTRYTSLLQQSEINVTMMLENLINDEFTGVYDVTVTIMFYKEHQGVDRSLRLRSGSRALRENLPADLIIPVVGTGDKGYWFRIEHELDVAFRSIEIPRNAKRVVLELYVSYHGNDEFWYTNPPNEYIEMNKLNTNRGNGAFREVFVRIDGKFVGSVVPFPVIFTGGINPLAWEPVVAIGAFDLPSYDFDLTPFLGLLVDGKNHSFEIGVENGIEFWLLDANLHVWVDKGFYKVDAKLNVYKPPKFYNLQEYEFNQLDGSFEVEALRKSKFSGWVASSSGNLTTTVTTKTHISSSIMFQKNGTYKITEHKGKIKTRVMVRADTGLLVSLRASKRKAPLTVITSTVPGSEKDTDMMITNITHRLREKITDGRMRTSIDNTQVSGGWMLVKDHSVLSGTATTHQTLSYRGHSGCFFRSVVATDGKLVRNDSSSICPSLSSI